MKTAVLVVSFGTTHLDTLEKTICRVEEDIKKAFPNNGCYRAFTSSIVRRRLKEKYNIHVDSVEEAVKRMKKEGVTHILAQPTHLVPGHEYDKLCVQIANAAGDITFAVGKPLLCDDDDLCTIADILKASYPCENGETLVAMGHGTDHDSSRLYERLSYVMAERGMVLATVEGKPDFDDALSLLKEKTFRKVHLVPMLLVSGDHSKNDMAGEEGSLRCLLSDAGFEVRWTLQGLGEIPEVRQMYVERLKAVEGGKH